MGNESKPEKVTYTVPDDIPEIENKATYDTRLKKYKYRKGGRPPKNPVPRTKGKVNTSIKLELGEDDLLDVRSVLFSKNLSIQEFITFLFNKLSCRDEALMDLVEELEEIKMEKYDSISHTLDSKKDIFDPELIYEIIRKQQRQR